MVAAMVSLPRALITSLFALAIAPNARAAGPDVIAEPGSDPEQVVGGFPSATCGWPSTVSMQGMCSGTLVHPQVVIYAQHCGQGYSSVQFGESGDQPARSVPTEFCMTYPGGGPGSGHDFAFCKLAQPVTDVPIVPILMGCETEMLVGGQNVTIVGFGFDENNGYGIKREVVAPINSIDQNQEIFIGGNGKDSCNGDSGGPVFIQMPDQTWRVFGITSYGGQCGTGGYYSMMHVGMEWFEMNAGIDITPCHDAQGNWAPNGECQGFPIDPGTAGGNWPACNKGQVGGASMTCGSQEPDTTPPTVVITAPADGTIYDEPMGADITVSVDAQDVGWGVKEVHLTINGAEIPGGIDGSAPFEFNATFPTGQYEIGAFALDLANNQTVADSIVIYVNTAPEPPEPMTSSGGIDGSGGLDETGIAEGGTAGDDGALTEPTGGDDGNASNPSSPTGATSLTGASDSGGQDEGEGCGCRSGQDPKASLLALAGLGVLVRRRRR